MPNRLTEKKRWGIVCLKDYCQLSNYKIASVLDISKTTVKTVYERFQETGSVNERAGRGRQRKLTNEEELFVSNYVQTKPRATAREITYQIAIEFGKTVSRKLVCAVLHRSGFRSRIARPVPFLTSRHSSLRHDFATRYQHKQLSWWKSVKFSDECSFELGKNGQV